MRKKGIIANTKLIKKLREQAFLKQENMPEALKSYGLKTSLRNYQRAEEGHRVSKDYLSILAEFFDRYLKQERNIKISITTKDLIKDKNVPISNRAHYENPEKLKSENESSTLYKIKNEKEIIDLLKNSNNRKFFYESNFLASEIDVIEAVIKKISEIKKKQEKKIFSTTNYSSVDQEISFLRSAFISDKSDFDNDIKNLNSKGINLYAGIYYLPSIKVVPEKITRTEPHPSDPLYTIQTGQFTTDYSEKAFAIYCFKKIAATTLMFNYENLLPKKKIEEIIKLKKIISFETDEFTAEDWVISEFKNKYKNNLTIDEERVFITVEDF
jgi:hypothetical protein